MCFKEGITGHISVIDNNFQRVLIMNKKNDSKCVSKGGQFMYNALIFNLLTF